MSQPDFFFALQRRINHFLELKLGQFIRQDSRLRQAMSYSLLAEGKRIRPLLVYSIAESINAPLAQADYIAAAIESIHAYSLIHDDLPAMDDDDLRRGVKTCHIAFDEATAILAGDALHSFAFELLGEIPCQPEVTVKLSQILAKSIGANGMAGGQSLDLEAEGKSLDLPQLQQIHAAKTGALLEACVMMSSQLVDLETAHRKGFNQFAKHFGIAFQIVDDILDITADTATLGKPAKSDQYNDKATYPKIMGLSAAKETAHRHIRECSEQLHNLPYQSNKIQSLTEYVLNRSF